VLRGDYSEDQSLEINNLGNIPHEVTSNLEGILFMLSYCRSVSLVHFRSNKSIAHLAKHKDL